MDESVGLKYLELIGEFKAENCAILWVEGRMVYVHAHTWRERERRNTHMYAIAIKLQHVTFPAAKRPRLLRARQSRDTSPSTA